ncbi:MAG: AraC family transcriptional regulator [Lachnospiraceae bacterium]|nr:AraC family transcriptional regulator [Lachnospiraceae bacterium]
MAIDLEEKKSHGTDYFPFECYGAQAESNRFLVYYHWHRQIEIICVDQGELILMVEGETHVGQAGDIFFINPGQVHQLILEQKNSSYFSFVFEPEWLDFKQADYVQDALLNPLKKTLGFPLRVSREQPCHQSLLRDIHSIKQIYVMQPDCYRLMIKIQLYKLLLLLETNQLFVPVSPAATITHSQITIRIRELTDYIAAHYQEHISLEQGAEIMHMSPKYFSSFFAKTFLVSFTQYVNHYRVDQACVLLKTTDLPIMEIAFETGFENFSYFIRKFKEIRGCTPKEYRKERAPIAGEASQAIVGGTGEEFRKIQAVLAEI